MNNKEIHSPGSFLSHGGCITGSNTIMIAGVGSGYSITGVNHTIKSDYQHLLDRLEVIEARLAIIEPNQALQDKYPALQEAYDAYKIIEKMVK